MAYMGTPEGGVQSVTIKRTAEHDRCKVGEVLAVRGTTQQPGLQRHPEDVNIRIVAGRGARDVLPLPPRDVPPMVQRHTEECRGEECIAAEQAATPSRPATSRSTTRSRRTSRVQACSVDNFTA